MTIPFATGSMMGVNFSDVYVTPTGTNIGISAQTFPVGQLAEGGDGSKWVYVKFGVGGSTGLGYVHVYDEDFLAVMMSNSVGALGDKVGVSPAVALVDNYGWLQTYGTCDSIRVSALCGANVPLASTVTAGQIDDSVANPTKNLSGIWLTTTAIGAGLSPGVLNWPTVGTTN